jgi:hypothetical protein
MTETPQPFSDTNPYDDLRSLVALCNRWNDFEKLGDEREAHWVSGGAVDDPPPSISGPNLLDLYDTLQEADGAKRSIVSHAIKGRLTAMGFDAASVRRLVNRISLAIIVLDANLYRKNAENLPVCEGGQWKESVETLRHALPELHQLLSSKPALGNTSTGQSEGDVASSERFERAEWFSINLEVSAEELRNWCRRGHVTRRQQYNGRHRWAYSVDDVIRYREDLKSKLRQTGH